MIQALNPPCTAKTAEIMSRYRPIAPKPEPPTTTTTTTTAITSSFPESSSHSPFPQNIRQSPYLMNVWPHLQARPTRTRKRGRTALAPPLMTKRPRPHLISLPPSFPLQSAPFPPPPPHHFTTTIPGLIGLHDINSSSTNLVTLPLLPSIPILPASSRESGIDLNREATEIPEEKDFLQQLQGNINNPTTVFTPQPVRPVCSSITVGSISCPDLGLSLSPYAQIPMRMKKKKEIEGDVESEALPAVVSDSNNKVRLANSAYKEMVGQPECSWLDSCACKRICGEVMLHFSGSISLPLSSNGFSCWVTIEWGRRNGETTSVNAFCDVIKLSCESREYQYAWRFHTGSKASESNSKVSST
ncbi:uncharacterized protein LOC124928972 [Impatiens glandulifera]|uniref:uncharacterized protein LOC124928972 n=1 Tax=Impatiens glandulifera TaxID=253017 RepID=UPI001FB158D1|nr:uncharacterized protein LOC124928972 [Impatiens glandulifera]